MIMRGRFRELYTFEGSGLGHVVAPHLLTHVKSFVKISGKVMAKKSRGTESTK